MNRSRQNENDSGNHGSMVVWMIGMRMTGGLCIICACVNGYCVIGTGIENRGGGSEMIISTSLLSGEYSRR